MKRIVVLAPVVLVFLAVAACADDDDNAGAGPSTSAASSASSSAASGASTSAAAAEKCTPDKAGGEVRVAPRGVAAGMDTYTASLASLSSGWEGYPFYSALVRYDYDTREYVPVVAESLTPSTDGTNWTLKLRPGVTFGNGDPLDAAALIAHLDRHLGPDSKSRLKAQGSLFIKSYTMVDPLTVRFDLTAPYGRFPGLLAYGGLGMVQNVKVINQMGAEAFAKFPKGAGVGAYEIETWAPPEKIVLTAKDNWWGGPVCIKKITVSFIPDLRAAYDAYKQNETDFMLMNNDPALVDRAKSEALGDLHAQLYNSAHLILPNLGIKGYAGPTKDVRVRQAIAYAINPDAINQRAYEGKGWPGKGIVNEDAVTIKPTEGLPYDPNKAKELVAQVKAETGWDGSISMIGAATPASNKEAAIVIAALLDAVGFKVNLNADIPVVPLITQVSVDKNFETVGAWGIINAEDNLYPGLRGWDSKNPSSQNGYASAEYDAGLTQLRSATTPEAYQAALETLQTVVNRDVPFITWGADQQNTLARTSVKGVLWHNATEPIFDQAFMG